MNVIGSIFGSNVPTVTTTDNTGAAYNAPIQQHPGSVQARPVCIEDAVIPGIPGFANATDISIRVVKVVNGHILSVRLMGKRVDRMWVVPDGEDLAKYIAAAIAEQAMSE